jgi:hypothetical protein
MRVDLQRVRGRNGNAGGRPTPVLYSYWLLAHSLVVPSWLCRVAEETSNVTFPIPPILEDLFLLLLHIWPFACQLVTNWVCPAEGSACLKLVKLCNG